MLLEQKGLISPKLVILEFYFPENLKKPGFHSDSEWSKMSKPVCILGNISNLCRLPLSIDKNGIIAPYLYKLVSKLCVQMGSDPLHAFLSAVVRTTYNLAHSYRECVLHNCSCSLNV